MCIKINNVINRRYIFHQGAMGLDCYLKQKKPYIIRIGVKVSHKFKENKREKKECTKFCLPILKTE